MFRKRSWLHRGRIESDEGFAVVAIRRDTLVYSEGRRTMAITVDMRTDGFAVFLNSIGRWDDDPMHAVDEETRSKIADNVKRALVSQGQRVDLV